MLVSGWSWAGTRRTRSVRNKAKHSYRPLPFDLAPSHSKLPRHHDALLCSLLFHSSEPFLLRHDRKHSIIGAQRTASRVPRRAKKTKERRLQSS